MASGEGAYTRGSDQWREGRGHIPADRTNGVRGGGIYPRGGHAGPGQRSLRKRICPDGMPALYFLKGSTRTCGGLIVRVGPQFFFVSVEAARVGQREALKGPIRGLYEEPWGYS
eukprot:1195923-Prorocentrum_minimum.AAC.1